MCCAHLMKKDGYDVRGVFVHYGQASATFEEKAAKEVAKQLNIPLHEVLITSPDSGKFSSGEIRGRNLLLASAAITFAPIESGLVVLGVHAGTPYFDCSAVFLDELRNLVENMSDGRFSLSAPLINLEKPEIYDYLKNNRLCFESTYSCEAGILNGCGVCLSCQDRRALKN